MRRRCRGRRGPTSRRGSPSPDPTALVSRSRPVRGRLSADAPEGPGSRPRSVVPRPARPAGVRPRPPRGPQRPLDRPPSPRQPAVVAAAPWPTRAPSAALSQRIVRSSRRRVPLRYRRIPLGHRRIPLGHGPSRAGHRCVPLGHRRVPLGHCSVPCRADTAASRPPPPRPARPPPASRCRGRCARPIPFRSAAAVNWAAALVPLPLRHRDGAPGRGQVGVERPGALPFGRERRRRPGPRPAAPPAPRVRRRPPGPSRPPPSRRTCSARLRAAPSSSVAPSAWRAAASARSTASARSLPARSACSFARRARRLGPLLRLLGRQALGLGVGRAAVGGLDRAHGVRLDLRQPRGDPGQRGYQRLHRPRTASTCSRSRSASSANAVRDESRPSASRASRSARPSARRSGRHPIGYSDKTYGGVRPEVPAAAAEPGIGYIRSVRRCRPRRSC